MNKNIYSVLHDEYLNPWYILAETGTGRHLITVIYWCIMGIVTKRISSM